MLLWRESIIAPGAETMMLNIVARVLTLRHVLQRQVGDLRGRVVELLRELLLFRLERGDFGFQACDLGKKCLRRRLLVALLRRADLARSDIAARECGFRLLNGGAPALVDGKKLVRLRRQTTARQSVIEFLLMLTNPFDVVHAGPLRRHGQPCPTHPRLCRYTIQNVDARPRRQSYALCATLTALPGMTNQPVSDDDVSPCSFRRLGGGAGGVLGLVGGRFLLDPAHRPDRALVERHQWQCDGK